MDLDALASPGVIGSALSRRTAWDDAAEPSAPVPQNPAEILALLMDFSGSVALAELLAAPPAEGPSHPEARVLARTLRHKVRQRLDALLPTTLKPLVGRRAPSLPSVEELLLQVRSVAGEGVPDANAAKALAALLGDPLRSALGVSLRQAQAHLATLRWEITHELRALGPRADRLERVDAALQRSMQAKLGELLDRMEHAASLTFERACVHACAALPEGFDAEALADWTSESGWIERYRERCVRMTKALYGHLRRSLEGLLRAAAHAEGAA